MAPRPSVRRRTTELPSFQYLSHELGLRPSGPPRFYECTHDRHCILRQVKDVAPQSLCHSLPTLLGAGLPHFAVYQRRKCRRDPVSLQCTVYPHATPLCMRTMPGLRDGRHGHGRHCQGCWTGSCRQIVGRSLFLRNGAADNMQGTTTVCSIVQMCSSSHVLAENMGACKTPLQRRSPSYIDDNPPDMMMFTVTSRSAM